MKRKLEIPSASHVSESSEDSSYGRERKLSPPPSSSSSSSSSSSASQSSEDSSSGREPSSSSSSHDSNYSRESSVSEEPDEWSRNEMDVDIVQPPTRRQPARAVNRRPGFESSPQISSTSSGQGDGRRHLPARAAHRPAIVEDHVRRSINLRSSEDSDESSVYIVHPRRAGQAAPSTQKPGSFVDLVSYSEEDEKAEKEEEEEEEYEFESHGAFSPVRDEQSTGGRRRRDVSSASEEFEKRVSTPQRKEQTPLPSKRRDVSSASEEFEKRVSTPPRKEQAPLPSAAGSFESRHCEFTATLALLRHIHRTAPSNSGRLELKDGDTSGPLAMLMPAARVVTQQNAPTRATVTAAMEKFRSQMSVPPGQPGLKIQDVMGAVLNSVEPMAKVMKATTTLCLECTHLDTSSLHEAIPTIALPPSPHHVLGQGLTAHDYAVNALVRGTQRERMLGGTACTKCGLGAEWGQRVIRALAPVFYVECVTNGGVAAGPVRIGDNIGPYSFAQYSMEEVRPVYVLSGCHVRLANGDVGALTHSPGTGWEIYCCVRDDGKFMPVAQDIDIDAYLEAEGIRILSAFFVIQ